MYISNAALENSKANVAASCIRLSLDFPKGHIGTACGTAESEAKGYTARRGDQKFARLGQNNAQPDLNAILRIGPAWIDRRQPMPRGGAVWRLQVDLNLPVRSLEYSIMESTADDYRASITAEKAELAFNSIAEQLGNFEAAIFILDDALTRVQKKQLWPEMFPHIYRLTISWLILTTAKVEELWRKYGVLAQPGSREKMRAVLKEIADRGITDMRDKSVAHIIDRETDSPLPPQAITDLINKITRNDLEAFVFWIRDPEDPRKDTVSRALRLFRADIQKAFPAVKTWMPVSTYALTEGDVEF